MDDFLMVPVLRPVGVLDPKALPCNGDLLYGELGDFGKFDIEDFLIGFLVAL